MFQNKSLVSFVMANTKKKIVVVEIIEEEKKSIMHKIFYCAFYIDTKMFNISGMAYSTGGQFEACKQINWVSIQVQQNQ